MSLSKIIRSGAEAQTPMSLAPLEGQPQRGAPAGIEFRAVALGQEDAEPEPEPEEYQPPPVMLEEEANRRIREARAEGLKEGRQEAEQALAKVSEALARALLATGALRGRILQEAEEDLLRLAALIARKVMLREIAGDPAILAGMVQGALELAAGAGEVVVRLNPEDYRAVAERPEFAELSEAKNRVVLKGDPAVPVAGCLVETARGNIDAGVDGQLDQIVRMLSEERNARRTGHSED